MYHHIRILFSKCKNRFLSLFHSDGYVDLDWIVSNCSNVDEYASSLNTHLWLEAKGVAKDINKQSESILSGLPIKLGGGGIYPLLYFLTKLKNPDVILETGVAAGFSSKSFLLALHSNQKGHLYSSDYPYIRLKNTQQFIGILVDDYLKDRWSLFKDGDSVNLKRISSNIDKIDIFHYDSDKSYGGRQSALSIVEDLFTPNTILIFDDIQDNNHFKDYVGNVNVAQWLIFEFAGKYVGVVNAPS